MTGKECLDLLMGRLGRTGNPQLRAIALTEMILVQTDRLEKRPLLPHWIITEEAEAFTEPDEPRLYLPTDFIREVEDMNLMIVDADGNERDLKKKGWDDAVLEHDDTARGEPAVYTMRGNYLYLRPTPDDVYTVRLSAYYARQPRIVDDANFTNAWTENAPGLLIGLTGIVMAGQYVKDAELVTTFGVLAKDANEELNVSIVAFEEANRSRRSG